MLGICYDIRHALMGNREYQFVENGLTDEIKKYQGFIASDKNIYLKIYVLWPEMLFVLWALNDFSCTTLKKLQRIKVCIIYSQREWEKRRSAPNYWSESCSDGLQPSEHDS